MRELNYRDEYRELLTPEIVYFLTLIHEGKGRQDLLMAMQKDVLSELLETAKIQSTEGSNRIEGITTTNERLKKIVLNKTTPKNRSEREIAGYRDVLNSIHENFDYILVRPGMILQLHRDLYQYSSSIGGVFKNTDKSTAEELPDGTQRIRFEPVPAWETRSSVSSWPRPIRFEPVPAWETPEAVDDLCMAMNAALKDAEMDPLLLIPMFILDFLCIHPFNDGNGRMSRLLTLLLLYRSGYFVGKYISLEKKMADSKESYYEALQESSEGWHEGKNDILPFARYLLGIISAAYREFIERADVLIAAKLSKPGRVREFIRSTTGRLTKAQIMEGCPDVSQKTVERALKELIEGRAILKIGGGRYTSYIWNREND